MAEDYPVNIVFDAIDQVSKPMRRINDRIERMTGPVRRVNNRMRALGREGGLQRISDTAGRVRRRLGDVAGAAGQVATRLGVMGGAAAFGMQRMFSGFGRTAEELAVLKEETGASLSFLQEWGFVAERAGVPADRFKDSVRELNGRLGELRGEGAGPLAETLKEMNPQLLKQLNQTNSLEEAWSVYMSAMAQANTEQERAALASAAFSDEGRVLGNVAAMGSERVRALRQEAQRYGQVMGQDSVQAGREYMNSQRNLMDSFSGLSVIISGSLLPVVNELFRDLTNWIVNNQSRVREWAEQFADKLPARLERIGEAAAALFDTIGWLTEQMSWLFDTFGAGNTLLVAAGAIIGGPLIAAVAALVPAVISLGAAIGFTPIGWFIGGVAAIAAGIWGLKAGIDWFEDRFPQAFKVAQDAFGVFVDSLTAPFDLIFGRFDAFMEKIRRIGDTVDKYIPDWMSDWLSGDSNSELRINTDGSAPSGSRAGPRAGRFVGARGAAQASARTDRSEKRVKVDFENLPQGARVTEEGDADDVPVNVGRSMSRGM